MTAEVHPILCQDRDPCLLAWRWDADARALIPVPAADGRPVANGDITLLTPRPASDQD